MARSCAMKLHQIHGSTAPARTTWGPKLAVRKSTLGRHQASPERPFCPARQTLAGPRLGSRWPLPNEAAGGSEALDHLPAYPARGPEPTFATAGGSSGTRRLDVEVLSTSSKSLFDLGPK